MRFCFLLVERLETLAEQYSGTSLEQAYSMTKRLLGNTPTYPEEAKRRFRKRVVLANVPSFRFSLRGNMRTYPRSGFSFQGNIWMYPRCGFRSGGTSAKTTLLESHPCKYTNLMMPDSKCPTLEWVRDLWVKIVSVAP